MVKFIVLRDNGGLVLINVDEIQCVFRAVGMPEGATEKTEIYFKSDPEQAFWVCDSVERVLEKLTHMPEVDVGMH